MTKPTKWYMRPAKTQISMCICPVWSESSLSAWRKIVSLATHWIHSKDWSDWADTQADLSLRWAHSHFVGFVMSRLFPKIWAVSKIIPHNYVILVSKRCSWIGKQYRPDQTAPSGSTLCAQTCWNCQDEYVMCKRLSHDDVVLFSGVCKALYPWSTLL